MGQTSSDAGPFFQGRRVWLATFALALAMALLTVAPPGATADEGDAWATLELTDEPVGTVFEVHRDMAIVVLTADWGGTVEDGSALLVIDPLPLGWSYQVDRGIPTESGYLLYEPGTMVLTVRTGEGSLPGTHYIEPRLDHPTEGRSLASVPVLVKVPSFFLTPVIEASPGTDAVPGDVLVWSVSVEAGIPIDRHVTLEVAYHPGDWQANMLARSTMVWAGESEPMTFTMTVSPDTLPGDYVVLFAVRSPDPRAVEYNVAEVVTVGPVRASSSPKGEVHLVAAAGEVVSQVTTVVNDGNVPMTILGVLPDDYRELPRGWALTYQGLPVTVPPRSSVDLDVGISLPSDPTMSLAGGHVIPVRLMTDKGVMDIDLALEVFVPEHRAATIEAPGSWYVSDEDLGEISLDLRLTDVGNTPQERAVWLTHGGGPAGSFITVSEPVVTTRSGSVADVTLTVRLSSITRPGEHWVHLKVMDGSGGLAELDVPIHVAEPRLSLVGGLEVEAVQDEGYYAGGNASIYVVTGHVENQGEEDLDFVKVDVYDFSAGRPVHLGYVPIYDLRAGAVRTFRFTLDRAEPGENVVIAHASVPGANGDPFTNSLESTFAAEATVTAPEGQYVLLVFAVAIGSLAGLIAILATEAGRFGLLVFFLVPLYTRLKPEQVTDHFIRGQILGYVKANPGETYTHIKKALSLSNGTFVYHARILESQGLIRSVKDGANRRFYPADMRIPTEVRDVELNQVQRLIYTIVMEYPGISQTKIAKMVKLAPSTVNYHVNIMTKVGVIERKRSGRLSLCFAIEDGE